MLEYNIVGWWQLLDKTLKLFTKVEFGTGNNYIYKHHNNVLQTL